MRESKASVEDNAEPSDYKESYHQLQVQVQQQQQKDSSHMKGSKQSPTKNGDGRTSKERDRDRQREHEKEAEKEKERLREREIKAFREFSKDLPFKQPSMPQIRRVAGSSYLPSSDFDIDENASHLPIPNILSNGANSNSNSNSSGNHVGSSNGSSNSNNDGNSGPSSGTYFNTGTSTGGHVSLGPLGDTGIRLRGGLTGIPGPGPAPLAMSTGRPQIPSIEGRSAAVQGNSNSNSSGGMNANAYTDMSTSQGQGTGYHGSSSSTDNGNNVVNSSNSSSNSSSSSRSSSHMNLNLNGSNSLGGSSSSSTLIIPGIPHRHQPQPLGNIPVQHSASNITTHNQGLVQGQNSSSNKYRDNPLSGSNNAYAAPIGALTITTAIATATAIASASSTLSCHSILGQNTELTSSSAFDDDIRHSGGSSSSATHANTMVPGEHTFNAHTRLNSRGSLFDVRSDASYFSESDSTNYSTINSTMSTVMGVSTGSTRTGDINAITSLMNMNGFTSSAASSHMGSASVSATSTLTMNLNSLNIRDRGAVGQSLLDPLDALHYSQLPLQTLPQIRDGTSNDMMTADSKTSTGTYSNGNGVSNTGGDGAPSLHGIGGIQGSKQHTRLRDHKHGTGTRNGKGKSSARSNQVTSNPHNHIQSQHQHSTRTLTHMQEKGTGGGAPKFR